MSEIKPKKERRFLKTLGRVGEILVEQVLLKLGSSIIKKIGGKKTLPSILFLVASLSLFAQFPNTGNKQRLGFQTTGDGLVWRGALSDTASIQPINNQSAWVILDTINLKFYTFDFTSNVWNLVGGGGSAFTQPVDSLFFNVGVPTNNVDTAKMRWDSDLATVVLGLNDNVPNEIGFKNFWLVKNQTGSTIAKGSLVYANGTVGASGRITVAKFIANGSIDAKYLLGITAHDLTDGEDGYVISFGKIRQINTDTFAAGAILYPSPTTAGVWTDVEPIAPNIDMPIGFCINSSVNNGTIAIRVASGYKLSELHDLAISSPIEKASLYYSGGLWRDTTAALLVSDTASMLTPYYRDADTTSLNLTSRFAAKLNLSDTASMLTNYLRTGVAANTYLPLTGGTLSSFSNDNNFTDTILNINYSPPSFAINQNISGLAININNRGYLNIGITSEASTILNTAIGVKGRATQSDINGTGIAYGIVGEVASSGSGSNGSTYAGYFNNTSTVGGNHYGLFVNTASGGDYGIYQTGSGTNYFGSNTSIGGTLGVTGATTLSAPLTVNSSAVFNEGSTDSDFRVESDGNANMVFVDASTDRVGIGYASPTKTLDVNGEVRINTVTATPTSLLGKDGSNVVGEVTTVAQTGLMTRGETTATTGSPSATFTVTHGLGSTPTSVLVTSAGLAGAEKIIFEVYTKNSTTFSVQAWNYDGTEASNKSVKIFWLAIK